MNRFLLFLIVEAALTQAVPLATYDHLTNNGIQDSTLHSKDIIDLSSYGSALYGQPDLETTAALVGNYSVDTDFVNPEELGSYLEGDMLVPKSGLTMKNGFVTQSSRWPDALVPYEIRGDFNDLELMLIQNAMEHFHERTCITFVPHTVEKDYIAITSEESGCWSSVGRVGGEQRVNLQIPGCVRRVGTSIHELMHALGFFHEQNRKERDDFVAIQYKNIRLSGLRNFRKVLRTEAFGVPYDYGSVMHYSEKAFSVNGQPTMIATQTRDSTLMGQRLGLSEFDIEKINRMYSCGDINELLSISSTKGPVTQLPESSTQASTATSANTEVGNLLSYLISRWGLKDNEQDPESN